MKNIKKVKINPGCISCGTCAYLAPDVFKVTDISRVKKEVDINIYEEQIRKAIQSCPMGIIHYQDENVTKGGSDV